MIVILLSLVLILSGFLNHDGLMVFVGVFGILTLYLE